MKIISSEVFGFWFFIDKDDNPLYNAIINTAMKREVNDILFIESPCLVKMDGKLSLK